MMFWVKNRKNRQSIIIDEEDYEILHQHRWSVNNQGTVVAWIHDKVITIHSFLLGSGTNKRQNFYIDGNKFNCQKTNISIGVDIKKIPKAFERNCPKCDILLKYKSKRSFYNACYDNAVCRSCTQLGQIPWNKGLNKATSLIIMKTSRALIISGNRKNKKPWNLGLSSETDERVKLNTEATRITLLQLHKEGKIKVWNHGKPFPQVAGANSPSKRPEVREKMAKSALNLKNKKYQCTFNPKACSLFDEINKEMAWHGLHALNNPNGEHRIYSTMYHVDFYEPTKNIVIEFYEKWHNKPKCATRDAIRQNKIIKAINCHFYIIKQGEENLWRQIINKPFWLQAGQASLDHTLLSIA